MGRLATLLGSKLHVRANASGGRPLLFSSAPPPSFSGKEEQQSLRTRLRSSNAEAQINLKEMLLWVQIYFG
ncbi:actin cytoskeleton-regulatory complex protein pan1 [Iris pallida]|uniref:Actin cytoskeleton-regulatory complex protein pan1 n=1 Tax=Iris pallida TaxID=29817 RepID=A0AAX6HGZ3_IRIPA|nr:actin cytoskeleton-regulatory complex protein pan1 [Iris pallida]